ncbi:carnitine metabolism transcriptional regulator CaiF [Salmonella enterica subsp. enterica serovar Bredeney]
MSAKYVEKPIYFLIANWMMAEKRWICAKEIAKHFNMDHRKAVNAISYILAEVGEISCETKIIPNQLKGRGCQCQRLVRVTHIDPQLYTRMENRPNGKMGSTVKIPRFSAIPGADLNCEQKWHIMLSKSLRRY